MPKASRRHHFSAWALIALAGAACSESLGTDELEHTEGVYIHANHPIYWSGSDYASFVEVTALAGWGEAVPPAGSDDLAQRWLQYWTDRIDEIVRAKVKADTGKELVAPKPIMHLLPTPNTANAWVSGLPACIPWQVRPTEGSAGDEDAKVEASTPLLFNQFGQNVHELGGSEEAYPCLPREDFEPFADFFVREWNKSAPACPAKLAGDGVIEVAEACMGSFASASRSAIYTTSNHIQFASDLLAAGTESGAVFVVAHELAHYYRAHVSPLTKHEYGFWYDQDARTARKPLPSRDQAELEALYKEVEALPNVIQAEIPGARHSKRFQRLVVRELCDYVYMRHVDTGLPAECAETNSLCEATLGLNSTHLATEAEVEAYLALEDELDRCGTVERIGAVESAPVNTLILALQASRYLPGGPAESVPLPQSFGALIAMLEKTASEHDATLAKFAEKLRLGRIGLYTTEQEADDLALEWVNLLGFSSDEAIDGWLTYLDYFSQGYTAPGELSVAECRSLYASNFKNGRAFVTVSLGDLQSAHHSGCYRVYNLWREQRAHKYVPAAELERPDFTTWTDVLAHATALSQPAW